MMSTRLLRLPKVFILTFALSLAGIGAIQAQTRLEGLGATGPVEKIQGDFEFLEGPAKTPDGSLFFTDIPANSIYQLTVDGEVKLFLKPSLHANGLMFGGENRLLACQMDGQLASIDLKTKQLTVLSDAYQESRYNACNDLVIDRSGGIYFTDPRYRAPEPWPQTVEAFYYRSPNGEVTRLGSDLKAPNGIILSPDEMKLYVIPSMQAEMFVYDVVSPGKIENKRVLCSLQQVGNNSDGGGDGLAIDSEGNLYITTATGIQVYSPAGKLLGTIEVPEQPANCAFGGEDNRTLFITARTGLYRCPNMPIEGHVQRTE
jgi:gluconolactonase